jgi:hypothetical protein
MVRFLISVKSKQKFDHGNRTRSKPSIFEKKIKKPRLFSSLVGYVPTSRLHRQTAGSIFVHSFSFFSEKELKGNSNGVYSNRLIVGKGVGTKKRERSTRRPRQQTKIVLG